MSVTVISLCCFEGANLSVEPMSTELWPLKWGRKDSLKDLGYGYETGVLRCAHAWNGVMVRRSSGSEINDRNRYRL